MPVTSPPARSNEHVALGFAGDLFDRVMEERFGATSERARGKAIGYSHMTIRRWRAGNVKITLAEAYRIADLLRVLVKDLFPRQPAGQDAA